MKTIRYAPLVVVFLMMVMLSACAAHPTQEPTTVPTNAIPTVTPTIPSATVTPTTLPVKSTPTVGTVAATIEALAGDWVRVLVSNPNPDKTGHFWLRMGIDGTFAVTTNKMQFDTNVDHLGTYVLTDDTIVFTALAGSTACVGQSATYQLSLFTDGHLEFVIVDVPCANWLSMGAGKLGEDTIWVRVNPK